MLPVHEPSEGLFATVTKAISEPYYGQESARSHHRNNAALSAKGKFICV